MATSLRRRLFRGAGPGLILLATTQPISRKRKRRTRLEDAMPFPSAPPPTTVKEKRKEGEREIDFSDFWRRIRLDGAGGGEREREWKGNKSGLSHLLPKGRPPLSQLESKTLHLEALPESSSRWRCSMTRYSTHSSPNQAAFWYVFGETPLANSRSIPSFPNPPPAPQTLTAILFSLHGEVPEGKDNRLLLLRPNSPSSFPSFLPASIMNIRPNAN